MASFREHVGFSGLLGVGYGLAATFIAGFEPSQAALAGYLAGVAGMLPDLDSPTGKPGQEIFSLTAAALPLVLINKILDWAQLPSDTETVMLTLLLLYFAIRYGGSWIVSKLCVHRGMFHSIPAVLIAAEITYLFYPSQQVIVKFLMAGGVAIGYASHLVLDEIYSVTWKGPIPRLKKSFGTAIKFFGQKFGPAAFTYLCLAVLTFGTLVNAGVIAVQHSETGPVVEELEIQLDADSGTESDPFRTAVGNATDLSDAPQFEVR